MSAPTFDTLAYTKRLKEAGISDDQAEAHAEALTEVIATRTAQKSDLELLDIRVQGMDIKISAMDAYMHEQFSGINQQFSRTNQQFISIDQQFARSDERLTCVEAKLTELSHRVTELELKFVDLKAELFKWMATFWLTQIATTVTIVAYMR